MVSKIPGELNKMACAESILDDKLSFIAQITATGYSTVLILRFDKLFNSV